MIGPIEVKEAARVLAEVCKLYDMNPQFGEWSSADLLAEIPHITKTYEQETVLDRIATPLVEAVVANMHSRSEAAEKVKEVLRKYEIREELFS